MGFWASSQPFLGFLASLGLLSDLFWASDLLLRASWLGLVGCSKEECREGVREGLAWRSGPVQGLRLRGGRW